MSRLVLCGFLLLSALVYAQPRYYLVSDIDDTIRRTHIHGSKLEIAANGLDYSNSFAGMADLFEMYLDPSRDLTYLSGVPWYLASFAENSNVPRPPHEKKRRLILALDETRAFVRCPILLTVSFARDRSPNPKRQKIIYARL